MDLPCFEEKTSAKTNMEPEKGHLEKVRTISKPHISKFGMSFSRFAYFQQSGGTTLNA